MSRILDLLERKRQQIEMLKRQKIDRSIPEDNRILDWDKSTFRIIAELKRASLSAGPIRPELELPSLAKAYEKAGAAALSVLTEEHYFGGSLQDLITVCDAVSLPLLQKDFILDEIQIAHAKQAGASFVLLIAKFLEDSHLSALAKFAEQIKVNTIVEITDLSDLEKITFPVRFLGVNSRDLKSLEVDTNKFEFLRPFLPNAYLIAESGIKNMETLRAVVNLGYHGALIGEHFLRSSDPAFELKRFTQISSRRRPKVKICGITSEQDAILAIEAGASALGFIFAESPRRISPEVLASFRSRIPRSVLCVGVFKGQTSERIHDLMQRYDLDIAQIYDEVDPATPMWKARIITSVFDFEGAYKEDQTLWDFKVEEPELTYLWNLASKRKIFALAGGLHPGNVARAVRICNPEWVDVARGVEQSPGLKDPSQIRAFMKELS
ncbi:MAG TPA: bifunctional indole-3-glycerol phosphate synthase/phosphoribosylanthranilate isomerase [Acidobacteriota bacterium]|nr:bifunctional indole-3-glycerol phosphate synthase/phosphoribosylanthranilate isomerase [Acidobacteriota bacterium]